MLPACGLAAHAVAPSCQVCVRTHGRGDSAKLPSSRALLGSIGFEVVAHAVEDWQTRGWPHRLDGPRPHVADNWPAWIQWPTWAGDSCPRQGPMERPVLRACVQAMSARERMVHPSAAAVRRDDTDVNHTVSSLPHASVYYGGRPIGMVRSTRDVFHQLSAFLVSPLARSWIEHAEPITAMSKTQLPHCASRQGLSPEHAMQMIGRRDSGHQLAGEAGRVASVPLDLSRGEK